jgi:large subunit ribosomal protein L17
MRHHNANRKFGRDKNQRKALLNSLARSLVLHDKIKTTEPKAKEVRALVERLVTYGKKGTVASARLLAERVGKTAAKKVADTLAKKYDGKQGGYTRITKSGRRTSDGAGTAIIEFV